MSGQHAAVASTIALLFEVGDEFEVRDLRHDLIDGYAPDKISAAVSGLARPELFDKHLGPMLERVSTGRYRYLRFHAPEVHTGWEPEPPSYGHCGEHFIALNAHGECDTCESYR